MPDNVVKLGVVGCGDVAFRTYLPGLQQIADRARVVAFSDARIERAQRAAAFCAGWSPDARTYEDYADMLQDGDVDAVMNLTPVPFHREVSEATLRAGRHVYTEKPITSTIEEADALIGLAKEKGLTLLCAPGVMATGRFRWLKEVLASGRLGRPTLATGTMAGMGPAGWRAYTGDPAVFYGPEVGPLIDQGVYLLHAITGLLGPAKRVQAMGGISIPKRQVLNVGELSGREVEVGTNDHMLIQLDFGEVTFAQVLSSYAIPATDAPTMELHCTGGSIGVGEWYNANGRADIFVRDDGPLGLEGWMRGVAPPEPGPVRSMIATGAAHFVGCLSGQEEPILTAEHARHVLEVILKSALSAQEGGSLDLETSF